MLLGEYIYGGHWPLDFGSLESDDYTATKLCIAKVYNSIDLNVFSLSKSINNGWVSLRIEWALLLYNFCLY